MLLKGNSVLRHTWLRRPITGGLVVRHKLMSLQPQINTNSAFKAAERVPAAQVARLLFVTASVPAAAILTSRQSLAETITALDFAVRVFNLSAKQVRAASGSVKTHASLIELL